MSRAYFKTIGLTVLLATLALNVPLARAADDNANSKVYPVNSEPHGLSYAEWSARHWQWLYSQPVDANPLFDTADCSAGQSGHVWFLGGTFATTSTVDPSKIVHILGKVTRECRIPSGTALFFPLVAAEASTLEGSTPLGLLDDADFFADLIVIDSLTLEIDGKPVTNLTNYDVVSPAFTFGPLPANNVLGADQGSTALSVSDGFFVMVKALPVGKHTIHFTGTIDATLDFGLTFSEDITYNITIVPAGQYKK